MSENMKKIIDLSDDYKVMEMVLAEGYSAYTAAMCGEISIQFMSNECYQELELTLEELIDIARNALDDQLFNEGIVWSIDNAMREFTEGGDNNE